MVLIYVMVSFPPISHLKIQIFHGNDMARGKLSSLHCLYSVAVSGRGGTLNQEQSMFLGGLLVKHAPCKIS